MNIGITGGNGFIGSHLKKKIKNPILFKGDLKDLKQVRKFILKCDRIYHLAGKNREEEGGILQNNIISTANLIFAMIVEKKYPEIIFSSSKQATSNPNSEYGFTKTIEEELIKKTKKWCIFDIPNVYGPGGKPFYNSVVATFCYQITNNQAVTINSQNTKREFIFIDDLINELLLPKFNSYKKPKGEIISIKEIYLYLTEKLGYHKNLEKCLNYYKKE
ncbi:MAG: NAD-dependent epimerase/dehydratase family protein [Candidatus Aenigmarchaeota archaeon]|nr:NAD-dependent epimerase/dehydratase family protein [Candidatus Aenigmarchaeota archaeon]